MQCFGYNSAVLILDMPMLTRQLLSLLAGGRPHHITDLAQALGCAPQQLNYLWQHAPEYVQAASEQLAKAGVTPKLMVDCSHANSRKDFRRQMEVAQDVAAQIRAGEQNIMGVMVESHLVEGRQDKPEVYGQSITDACIGWDETEAMLALLAQAQRESGRV